MSAHYEEIIEGEVFLRQPPGARHEIVLERLHARLADSLFRIATAKMLEIRSIHQLTVGSLLRPDLTLLTARDRTPGSCRRGDRCKRSPARYC